MNKGRAATPKVTNNNRQPAINMIRTRLSFQFKDLTFKENILKGDINKNETVAINIKLNHMFFVSQTRLLNIKLSVEAAARVKGIETISKALAGVGKPVK